MDADPDSLNLTTAVDAHAVVNCNPHTPAAAGNVANAETAGSTMPPIPPVSNPNGYACVITCLIHADSTSPSSIEHANSRGFRLRKTLKSDPVSSENTAACLARSIVEDQYNHAYLHAISQDLVHRYGTAGSGSGSGAAVAAGKGKPRLNCNITLGYGDGNTTTVMIRQQDNDNHNENAGKVEDEQQDLPVPPPEETDNEASDMPSLDMKSDHDNEAEENGNNAMDDASANNVWVGNLLLLTKLAENGMTSVIQANDKMYQQVQSCSSFPAEIYISPSAAIRDATAPLQSYTQTSSITLITVNSDQAILHVQNKPTKEDIDEFTKHDGDLVTMVIPEMTGMPELGESVNHVNMNNVDPTTAAVNAMFTNPSNTNTANTLMSMHNHTHPYPHGHHPGAPAAYHPKLPFSMRKKDPNAPKRPLTSYMLFCLDERPKIRKEFPHARVPEIGKALGTRFRNLSEEEMAYYVNKAADLKEKYDQDKAEYYSNVPKGAPGVTRNPNATSEDVLEHYAIGAPGTAPYPYATFAGMDKVPKDPTKPKKPLSVYMLFCKEHRPQVVQENPHMRVPDIGRVLGSMYRKLTEEEMSFYQHRADLLKEQYDRDMAEWKARKAEEEKLGLAGGGGVGVPSMPALPGMMHGHGHHPHAHLAHAYRPPMVGMKRHRTKAPKDPNAPKKPKPSYLIYCSGRRADLREKMPGLTVPETGKILGAEWKNMGPAEKKVFEDLALEDKRRYERQLDEYNRTRTFE